MMNGMGFVENHMQKPVISVQYTPTAAVPSFLTKYGERIHEMERFVRDVTVRLMLDDFVSFGHI